MADHFLIEPTGDVLEPDGYAPGLSLVVTTMTADVAREYAARIVSLLRRFLNHVHVPGESPRQVLLESAEEAVERVRGFLATLGVAVTHCAKPNRELEFELRVRKGRSDTHAAEQVSILRRFYQLCGSHRIAGRTRANPLETPGWHLLSEDERRESWNKRFPKRPYGWINAGLRFRIAKRKTYLPLIEDPTGCGRAMTRAVVAYGCPETVTAVCIVLEENGCRWREAAWANALGWSVGGFGEVVFTSNKFDDDEHAKRIVLAPAVLAGTVARFEARPHPSRPGATMMDRLRELAAAGDRAALRAIPLFPNGRGGFHKHRTFNGHWFRPAMEAWVNEDGSVGLLIRSDVGSRRPTPHWYRHAEISRDLEQAIADCRTDADIQEACRRVCRSFGLKTDQSKRYAACLMRRIAVETQMRRVAARRAEAQAARQNVDVAIALPRLALSESERLVLALPNRRAAHA